MFARTCMLDLSAKHHMCADRLLRGVGTSRRSARLGSGDFQWKRWAEPVVMREAAADFGAAQHRQW